MATFPMRQWALRAALGALAAVIALAVAGWAAPAYAAENDAAAPTHPAENDAAALTAAQRIVQAAQALEAAGHVVTDFRTPPDSLPVSAAAVARAQTTLTAQLDVLDDTAHGDRAARIRSLADQLAANAALIESHRPELLRMSQEGARKRRELDVVFTTVGNPAAVTSLDNQAHHIVTRLEDAVPLAQDDLLRYVHMDMVQKNLPFLGVTLRGVGVLSRPFYLALAEEVHDRLAERIGRSAEYLAANGGPELDPRLIPVVQQFLEAGQGENGMIAAAKRRLVLQSQQDILAAHNSQLLERLLGEIDGLAADVQHSAGAPADPDLAVLTAALALTQHAATLGRTVQAPTTLSMTPATLQASAAAVAHGKTTLATQLRLLEGQGHDDRVERIQSLTNQLVANAERIQSGRPALLQELAAGSRREWALRSPVILKQSVLFGAMDDQAHRLLTQTVTLDDFFLYVHTSTLLAGHHVLAAVSSANVLQNATFIGREREAFTTAVGTVAPSMAYLSAHGGRSEVDAQLIALVQPIIDAGQGENNVFDVAESRLGMQAIEADLQADNQRILQQLQDEIDGLVAAVQ